MLLRSLARKGQAADVYIRSISICVSSNTIYFLHVSIFNVKLKLKNVQLGPVLTTESRVFKVFFLDDGHVS